MSDLFRPEAVEAHHRRGEVELISMRVSPPWTWAVFWSITSAFALLLLWSLLGTLPVTERGKAVLMPLDGPRPLLAQAGGHISRVHVRSGAMVVAGQPILEIEAPAVEGPALVAAREQEIAREGLAALTGQEGKLYLEQRALLDGRIQDARRQVASLEGSLERQARKVAASEKLFREGLLSAFQVEDTREIHESIKRSQQVARQALAQCQQERAALEAQHRDRVLAQQRDLGRVQATAEGNDLSRRLAVVTAAATGRVEGLQGVPGDPVLAGAEVGRIMPEGRPLEVVAFVAEQHRAFLREGGEAYLEIDQLPYGEFGSAKARIKRVAVGVSSPREIQVNLGGTPTEGSWVRVDLELLDDRPAQKARVPLQAGMLGQVRFVIRRQRVIARVLSPLRRLLD